MYFTYELINILKERYKNMRNKFLTTALPIIFILLITAPFITLQGAAKGVRLWFNVVLPSMLPCIILSDMLIQTYGQEFRYPYAYVLFTGLLCGYPMGAKNCADLYGRTPQSAARTQFLVALSNYSSPMFITNYCIAQTLMMKDMVVPILFILYFPPVLCIIFELIRNRNFYFTNVNAIAAGTGRKHLTIKIIDSSIMNGFEIITRLGGYIMLFSIFSEFAQKLPLIGDMAKMILCGAVEITTGSAFTCSFAIPDSLKIILVTSYVAFGGLSCAAQTKSVIAGSFYSIKKYICHKLLLAALTAATAVIVTYVLKL